MIITKKDINKKILDKINKGAIFIYPTDTIYGIGCIATNQKSIKKIREIKKRDKKPFSIIAPTKTWIRKNCEFKSFDSWIKKLPGPYTLILKLKDKKSIDKETNNNLETVGIRIPNHWIKNISKKIKKPLITTSVNISGEKHIIEIKDIPNAIKKNVDFIINEGKLKGAPSTIILEENNKIKILKR